MSLVDTQDIETLASNLDTIANYLIKVRDLTKYRKNRRSLSFAWDWEMLHEIIYDDDQRSVYSAILLYGLQCLSESTGHDGDWRILIPEGTRQELLHHLKGLVSDLRKNEAIVDATRSHTRQGNELRTRVPLFARSADWHEVLASLEALSTTRHRIERILRLLEQFATPSPLPAAEVPREKVQYYLQQMKRSRPDQRFERPNAADACNLAMVDELSDRASRTNQGAAVTLVTATHAVRQSEEFRTCDPFLFLLEAEVRKRYPDVHTRERRLCIMIQSVFEQLHKLRIDEVVTPRRRNLTRPEMYAFLEQITAFDQDPILGEMCSLWSKARQAVNNAAQLAQSLSIDIELPEESSGRFRTITRRIERTFKQLNLEAPNLSTLGLDVIERMRCSDRFEFSVREQGRDIIEGELTPSHCALRWDTEETFGGFCRHVGQVLEALNAGDNVYVDIRMPDAPSIESYHIASADGIQRHIIKAAKNRKLTFVRVRSAVIAFWYDFATRTGRRHHASVMLVPTVAVRFTRTIDRSLIGAFYSDTAVEWLFPMAITTELDRLCMIELE